MLGMAGTSSTGPQEQISVHQWKAVAMLTTVPYPFSVHCICAQLSFLPYITCGSAAVSSWLDLLRK